MDSDLQELEEQLRSIRPVEMNDALLDRLNDAISGTLQVTSAEMRPVEAATSRLQPSALSESLTNRLSEVVEKVPFPVDEKVVLFTGGTSASSKEKDSRPKWWAAAAAVAIAGGLSALMVSPPKDTEKVVESNPVPVPIESGSFVPAAFNSGVSNTDDLGVMWTNERKPVRVVRVIYKDVVHLMNERGEEVKVEVPRVEYLMVPEKID